MAASKAMSPVTGAAPAHDTYLVREQLARGWSPEQAVLLLRGDARPFALVGEWAGGGAILGSEPLRLAAPDADPFAVLDDLARLTGGHDQEPPIVGGGWFGWLGYPLGERVEDLPAAPPARTHVAPWSLAYHDHVVRFDGERWWFEALWTQSRDAVLRDRLALWSRRFSGPHPTARGAHVGEFALAPPGGEGHRVVIEEAVGRIAAGDLFQVNLCVRLEAPYAGEALDLFASALRTARPRFGALFGDSVLSLSPERFLRRRERHVESEPIKGTAASRGELLASEKDAAEHVMIVDLMRNDLGRVCRYGSVAAAAPRVEAHANLFHLVSTVSGELPAGATDADLLRAAFPPGSVTGAPKVQALKTISRLEASARCVYTGAIGYASPRAGLELSVAIRTFELAGDRVWLGAGGAIVADSTPEGELGEVFIKASGPVAAIGGRIAAASAESVPTASRAAALERALDYGSRPDPRRGLFETVLSVDGVLQHADEHLARLAASLRELYDVALPREAGALICAAAATIGRGRARIRLEAIPATRTGVTLRTHATAIDPAGPPPGHLRPFLLPGGLGRHKWLDRRLPAALAAAAGPGGHALLVDADGLVLETHRSNVWIAEGDALLTPPDDGRLLPGVTRAQVLAEGGREAPITLERLQRADARLVSSAIALLQPIAEND